MKLAIGIRLQGFVAPDSAGVVTDTLFVNCYWPKLDRPTRIFAAGSSLIKVMGTTPRNVWFPDDVDFLPYYPDALYPAELAVKAAFPFKRIGMVNLSPAEAQVWLDAYNAAVASFPPTHTVFQTRRDSNCLRQQIDYDEYTAPLTPDESRGIAEGTRNETTLRSTKIFERALPDGTCVMIAPAVVEPV